MKEYLKGGKGNKIPKECFDKKQLAIGKRIEREHTKNSKIAEEIARDHLTEDPNYYKKLKKARL
jgi:hypothetical protein